MPAAQKLGTSAIDKAGTYQLGGRKVRRLGYGAMQLTTDRAYGPPKDRDAAIAVLRAAVKAGVNHIDTSDFYGPHSVNQVIREALAPYPDDLVLVTKVGARRTPDKNFVRADSPEELKAAVHDNLRNLGVEAMDVVNLRLMYDQFKPAEGPVEPQLTALAELQRQGLIRHIGLSHATAKQVEEARQICEIVCVQNLYNLAHREDEALLDALAKQGIAYVPYFPLGGFSPLQSDALSDVAKSLDATPLQMALAWLLRRAENILLIPGTSSVAHLDENLAAATLDLPADAMATLDGIASASKAA